MPIDDPETYYDEHDREEWERLEASLVGRLEWEGTVEYLRRSLPPGGHVLDVGGGAGRYAVWLAERGHEVTLVDPSEGQRELAREKVDEHGVAGRVTVREGDVRDLPFPAGGFDATVCLGGPLSHVLDADERATGARELRRVTAVGGPVFVSVMGRLHLLFLVLTATNRESKRFDLLAELAASGDYDADLLGERDSRFVETHFFRAGELEVLLTEAGLVVEELAGLEGLASVYGAGRLEGSPGDLSPAQRRHVRDLVDTLRGDRSVADLSAHILAVCRVGE
ncbi:MAG: class I SAM-dependent methyltransferase [Haloarculaceae archaeon]